MFKVRMNRFFAVIAVLFCIGVNVLAEVKFSGTGSERVVVASETFKLKIDFSTAKQYYLDKSHWARESYDVEPDEQKMFKLIVGGCQVEMWAEYCTASNVKAHIRVGKDKSSSNYLDDETGKTGIMRSFNAVVEKDKITVECSESERYCGTWDGHFPCNIQFDKSSAPGRYVVDVSLSGPNIAPQLITTIDGDLFTTTTSTTTTQALTTSTQAPTTTTIPTTTTQAPTTSSMPTTTPEPTTTSSNLTSTTVMTLSCPQCENRGLEPWLIGLIVAVIVLALLAIVLCVAVFCCYRRLQKTKAQMGPKSENTTVKSTMSTVSTAPGPLIKETNQYGPDIMYFARDATPVDPNAKSQAVNPAPITNPMQPTQ